MKLRTNHVLKCWDPNPMPFSSELELSGVFRNMQMSLGCEKCDLKFGIGNRLRVHWFIKHGKLNLVTIVPDRGKLEWKVG